MKIIHISIYPYKNEKHGNSGGVASYTKNLATSIHYKDSDSVFVLCNKIDGKYENYVEDGMQIIRCFDKNIKFLFQILKEISKIRPDAIHIQQEIALFGSVFTAYLLQWLLFFLRSYNVIITLHGVVSLREVNKDFIAGNNAHFPVWVVKTALYVIYKPICLLAKKIIVHENHFKEILINEYNVNRGKIEVIHHGVESLQSIERDSACRQIEVDPRKNIVLFMGYLTGYKGIDLLIEGFSLYAQKNPNAFLMIGAGEHPKLKDDPKYKEEYARYKRKVQDILPAYQFRWVGFIPESEMIAYYSAADVSVYPYTISMSSSGPMAIAMGLGRPFLASDVFRPVVESEALLFQRTPDSMNTSLKNFFRNPKEVEKVVQDMAVQRLWSLVGEKTYLIYAV